MFIGIRVDTGPHIGTGHFMRCKTLADALARVGSTVFFVCRDPHKSVNEQLRDSNHQLLKLPPATQQISAPSPDHTPPHRTWLGECWETDLKQTLDAISTYHFDWFIIDHYAIDQRWETQIRTKTKYVMVIDDLADRPHNCDLLLDQTHGRSPQDYDALAPESCTKLIGSKFAMLRPDFLKQRQTSLQRRQRPKLKSILISMGGIDEKNYTEKVLTAIEKLTWINQCKVTVILGSSSPWLKEVKQCTEQVSYCAQLIVDASNMATLMAESDLAIGAAGSTSWERCCLGLPTIMFLLAENQKTVVNFLEKSGAVMVLKACELSQKIVVVMNELFSHPARLIKMSNHASHIIDGKGCHRVIEHIQKPALQALSL